MGAAGKTGQPLPVLVIKTWVQIKYNAFKYFIWAWLSLPGTVEPIDYLQNCTDMDKGDPGQSIFIYADHVKNEARSRELQAARQANQHGDET